MSEAVREILYPLGYLASIAFGTRFLLQWLNSEIQRKSVVTLAFWRLSLIGNLLLMIHSFFQLQYHVCVVQAINAIISWRNLNLMHKEDKKASLNNVVKLFIFAIVSITSIFLLQGLFSSTGKIEWFGLPHFSEKIGFIWHLIGFFGLILFSSRFWVQWWIAENKKKSELGTTFWWLSISGGILTLFYFVRIEDPVNIIGPAVGLIPYIRNLMLIQSKQKKVLA